MTEDPVMVERMRCLALVRAASLEAQNQIGRPDNSDSFNLVVTGIFGILKDIEVKILEGK